MRTLCLSSLAGGACSSLCRGELPDGLDAFRPPGAE